MRTGPNNRRMRGRGNSGGRRGGSPRSQHFDSNGPDIKVRGNAQQIVDKYQTLAREALTAGDRVMAENYYQHAEHYLRILSANQENRPDNSRQDGSRSDNADSGSQDDAQSDSGDAVDAASGDGGEKANGNGSRRGRSRPADDEAESETVEASDNADDGNDGDDSAETDDSAEKINNPAEIAARASRPRRRRPRPQPTEAGDAAS